MCFQLVEGKRNHSERQDSILFILRRPALRRNCFSKLLTIGVSVPNLTGGREIPNSRSFKLFMWDKGLALLQPSLAVLSHLRWGSAEGLQGTAEVHSPGAQAHSRLRPNHNYRKTILSPIPQPHITNSLFPEFPFP